MRENFLVGLLEVYGDRHLNETCGSPPDHFLEGFRQVISMGLVRFYQLAGYILGNFQGFSKTPPLGNKTIQSCASSHIPTLA